MKLIELDQDNDQKEWLNWRKGKLTASSSAPIMCTYTYKTPFMLWQSVLGLSLPIVANANMTRGKELEPEAREKINEMLGKEFKAVCCEHENYDFLGASLDGWCGDRLLEIKCPNPAFKNHISAHFDSVESFRKASPSYYHQIMWQIMCMGKSIESCYFATYWREEINVLEVPRDDKYIEKCEKKAVAWYNTHIVGDKEPKKIKVFGEPHNDGDFTIVEDTGRTYEIVQEANKINARELEIKQYIKEQKDLDKRKKELKEELAEYGNDLDFYCGNVKMVRIAPNRLDTEKLYRDYNITTEILESYKKRDIGYYKLSVEA